MDKVKFSFYFDHGENVVLESHDKDQIDKVLTQLAKKKDVIEIPSDDKTWYITMSKIKTYCIDKNPISSPIVTPKAQDAELP